MKALYHFIGEKSIKTKVKSAYFSKNFIEKLSGKIKNIVTLLFSQNKYGIMYIKSLCIVFYNFRLQMGNIILSSQDLVTQVFFHCKSERE